MDDTTRKATKASESLLLDALRQAGVTQFEGRAFCCPFCDDKHPSAGIFQHSQGWYFKCHKCQFLGDVFDVRAKAERTTPADQLRKSESRPAMPPPPPRQAASRRFTSIEAVRQALGDVSDVYSYTNPTSLKVELIIFRRQKPDGSKSFTQAHWNSDGLDLTAPPKPWPLYNRSRVRKAEKVFVVEGEKCVHALAEIDVVATTSPGGAGKAEYADWTPLAGKTAYLWPDNDPPDAKGISKGVDHMRQVAGILEKLNPPCIAYWIDPTMLGLPDKGDCVEYLEPFDTKDAKTKAIQDVTELARPLSAAGDLKALIEDAIAGRRKTISWPWPELTRATRALQPGSMTVICAEPGVAKSLLILQAAAHWLNIGVSYSVLELEEDRAFHLRRALAQKVGMSCLTDDEWTKDNPQEARAYWEECREWLDRYGQALTVPHEAAWTIGQVGEWVETQAAKHRVLAIDPITAAQLGKSGWLEETAFMVQAKKALVRHGASLIVVTHPRTGTKGIVSLEHMAGSSSWARFSQTAMWIKHFEDDTQFRCGHPGGFAELVSGNRKIIITKARSGPGSGTNIVFELEPSTLRLTEKGREQKRTGD